METGTIIRAINNLSASTREQLLGRISLMVVEALAEGRGGANGRGRSRDTNGSGRKADAATVRGRKSAAATATQEEVLAYIKANPDQRTEQIPAGMGSDVKPVLKKLREAKMIRSKGQKRAMTYSVAGKN